MDKIFKITFLGISAASVSPRTCTSAYLIELGETRIMVDAGIGALRQLLKTGLTPDILDNVLLTHWHYDHFAGLPAIIRYRNVSSPLRIYGPKPPLYVRVLLRSVFPAIAKHFTEIGDHYKLHYTDLTAESFPTFHRIPTVGWILAENSPGSRRIVISGDTSPVETLIHYAAGADLLVYEATYLEKHHSRAIRRKHSTVSEAATLAVKSNVKSLALTHISPGYALSDVRKEFEGIFPSALVPQPDTSISIETQLLDKK